MAQFKLLAGQHVADDRAKEPVRTRDPATGEVTERHPPRTYRAGEVVESDADLVAKFGAGHFELVGPEAAGAHARVAQLEAELAALRARTPGDPASAVSADNPSVAPGGQVSTGFQHTSGGVPGPLPADQHARAGVAGAAERQPQQQAPAQQQRAAAPRGVSDADLDGMTLAELRTHAAEAGVDLHGAKTRDEALKAVRKGRKG
jgi:hypothetical protein